MGNRFSIIEWSPDLDLTSFYQLAGAKGFRNNSSQQRMIDTFRREREWNAWILYYNNTAVGSVAAHSFDDVMGSDSYRILARTCVLSSLLPYQSLRTRKQIYEHQNATAQFYFSACIDWAPKDAKLYITTNENEVGTQRLMHTICFPIFEKKGLVGKAAEVNYRGIEQTVWKVYPDKILEDLNKYPRWNL